MLVLIHPSPFRTIPVLCYLFTSEASPVQQPGAWTCIVNFYSCFALQTIKNNHSEQWRSKLLPYSVVMGFSRKFIPRDNQDISANKTEGGTSSQTKTLIYFLPSKKIHFSPTITLFHLKGKAEVKYFKSTR